MKKEGTITRTDGTVLNYVRHPDQPERVTITRQDGQPFNITSAIYEQIGSEQALTLIS